MKRPTIEAHDRYSALGIPHPDPATVCLGPCEGTGIVPIETFSDAQRMGARWVQAWELSTDDDPVWKFVRCVDCLGTGKRVAS